MGLDALGFDDATVFGPSRKVMSSPAAFGTRDCELTPATKVMYDLGRIGFDSRARLMPSRSNKFSRKTPLPT